MCGKAFIKTVSKNLDKAGLKYEVLDDTSVAVEFAGAGDLKDVVQFILRQDEALVIITRTLGNIKEEDRTDVMTWVMEKNCNLVLGSFDLDPKDGELRFRMASIVDDIKTLKAEDLLSQMKYSLDKYRGVVDGLGDVFEC